MSKNKYNIKINNTNGKIKDIGNSKKTSLTLPEPEIFLKWQELHYCLY